MTQDTANQVAERLNELKVPACSFDDPLGQVLAQWTAEGGRLVVVDGPGEEKKIEYYFPNGLCKPMCPTDDIQDGLGKSKFGRWSV